MTVEILETTVVEVTENQIEVVTVGTPGPTGKSAYEIAVTHGFEGTEEEWLLSMQEAAAELVVDQMAAKADLIDGVIPSSQLPALVQTDVFVVDSEESMLALECQSGDVAIRIDISKSFVHNGGDSGTVDDWSELISPTDAVTSVNGLIGNVTLGHSDVGAAPENHTHDISDIDDLEEQLDGKADLSGAAFTGAISAQQAAGDTASAFELFNSAKSGSIQILLTGGGTSAIFRLGTNVNRTLQITSSQTALTALNRALVVTGTGVGISNATSFTPTQMLDVDGNMRGRGYLSLDSIADSLAANNTLYRSSDKSGHLCFKDGSGNIIDIDNLAASLAGKANLTGGTFTGNVAINGALTVRGTSGVVMGDSSADNTAKSARIMMHSYASVANSFCLFLGSAQQNYNVAAFGGGTAAGYAATHIRFVAAANNTTLTGTTIADWTIDKAKFNIPVQPPPFTVASVPSASTAGAGAMIYCTDGDSGQPCLAVSNGGSWRRVPLGSIISAS